MKRFIGATSGLLICAIAVTTIAATPRHAYDAPLDAAENYRPVRALLRHYERDGLEVYNAFENAYRYLTAPSGDHDWGTVTYQLRETEGNHLDGSYVTLTLYVRYIDADGLYRVSGFDTREQTTQ